MTIIQSLCITAFLFSIGCTTATPINTSFSGTWQACEITPQQPVMCLNETDLGNLRKILLQCGSGQ